MLPTIAQRFNHERVINHFLLASYCSIRFILKNFEKETGIKLYITYFENGPALLSKVVATKGSGYDMIIPDDHSLELLIQQEII